jgi:hypothetical protein
MRWIDVGLFIEVLQLGFETLVDQEERLQGPMNVAPAFFDQSVYQVVNRHRWPLCVGFQQPRLAG